MRELLWVVFAVAVALSTNSASAAPLEFSGITADTVHGRSAEISCEQLTPLCRLTRRSFGGVPINKSMVLFNTSTQKVWSIAVWADSLFENTAVEALSAKYGSPTDDKIEKKVNKQGGPFDQRTVTWKGFDGDARVSLLRGEGDLFVDIVWQQNVTKPQPPKVDF